MTIGGVRCLLTTVMLVVTTGGLWGAPADATVAPAETTAVSFASVVPAPVLATPAGGVTYRITATTKIYAEPGSTAVADIAEQFAAVLRRSTGYPMPVVDAPSATPADGIALLLSGAPTGIGSEGYQLDVIDVSIAVRANAPAGLFAGVQTLRQLLPPAADSATVQPGPWDVAGGRIIDQPRFAHRGAMLDVARHFLPMSVVKRYIDEIALYKVNRLHLHLSDDQGWRIAVNNWPDLAIYGGSTEVGGGAGGYYTQDEFRQLVAYAAARYVMIVPEIDMPGHTNAALASYADLNCDGVAPKLYTGTKVGFSSLCVGKEITYTFIDQVLGELAALTTGPYLHIGGDEASSTTAADYATFMNRAQQIVAAHGKTVVGWHDIVNASVLPSTVAQFWGTTTSNAAVATAAQHGTKVIMSPANHAYLDMKYNSRTRLGQRWAGYIDVQDAYGWDPGAYLAGVGETSVLGVEAPLWTETIETLADVEYMAFPRLPAIAELGWSPASTHDWASFQQRLGAQGPRWRVMGINYYHSTQVSWPTGS
ncbi:beta-N-acetylhexosaminidase [Micromonospora sp. 4G57]|uniref:beta-N-acetylhexosaminidase n=1 Tax=Micromonospora sicca TaxID=2202420 RepID=A0ABU5JBM4_9ACTN|nr:MULTISPECIES: beta-N-acetylhexosaminidase [unclassified Micromonospora]MDZ5441593.1 beta-N-acetylhexosaminidase [Micromonospora sp. 4G57]MDZ5489990.1 beta-N-acetylhexosaminidase [Micromonospora sp. 4G53]